MPTIAAAEAEPRAADWPVEVITRRVRSSPQPPTRFALSVTELFEFATCAHRYYLTRHLGLREDSAPWFDGADELPSEVDTELSPVDRGRLVHAVLEDALLGLKGAALQGAIREAIRIHAPPYPGASTRCSSRAPPNASSPSSRGRLAGSWPLPGERPPTMSCAISRSPFASPTPTPPSSSTARPSRAGSTRAARRWNACAPRRYRWPGGSPNRSGTARTARPGRASSGGAATRCDVASSRGATGREG